MSGKYSKFNFMRRIREMTIDELKELEKEIRIDLINLPTAYKTSKLLLDSQRIKNTKRNLARVLTRIREIELNG